MTAVRPARFRLSAGALAVALLGLTVGCGESGEELAAASSAAAASAAASAVSSSNAAASSAAVASSAAAAARSAAEASRLAAEQALTSAAASSRAAVESRAAQSSAAAQSAAAQSAAAQSAAQLAAADAAAADAAAADAAAAAAGTGAADPDTPGEDSGPRCANNEQYADEQPTGMRADAAAAWVAADAAAAAAGITMCLADGKRSRAQQQQTYDDYVTQYGQAMADQYVLPPEKSAHVQGLAVDVQPYAAYTWLQGTAGSLGWCRIYDNEAWHFEYNPEFATAGCPARLPHPAP